jgi:uncharacterized protein YrzB (UPF0473 family)
MTSLRLEDVSPIQILREAFGEEIILEDGNDTSVPYQILAEFALGARKYAVLQSEALKKEDECAFFIINRNDQGKLELETIMDDDEWEDIAELYDEMTFPVEEA